MRACLAVLGLAVLAAPAPAAGPVDYRRDIKAVLKERCYACHGALKQKAKLRLDTAAGMREGGRNGPVVVPGDLGESLILGRVTATDERRRMPPEGQPLTASQIAAIRSWIEQGASAPADEAPEEDPKRHWAFLPPVRPAVPELRNPPVVIRNPIDSFLAAEWQKRGLTPASLSDKATLLRRVYLDLVGLPPTREELHAFLADPAADAYEKVVDRLLASPQYGERWGRHWMDIWRYSDWYGRRSVPDVMNSYAQVWRWRDWIVRSLNQDRGYDRMVREMLAADELCPDDDEALVATGFLVRNWFKWNYNQWMRDNVEHTAKAFLGLTLNCCHCHDHKYDPVTQEEYFRFRAFFEPLELRHDRWPGEPDPGPFQKYVYGASYGPIASGMIRVFDEKPEAPTFFYTGGDERNQLKDRPPVPSGAPLALGGGRLKVEPVTLPPGAWYPGLKPFVRQEETAKRRSAIAAAEQALAKAQASLVAAEARQARDRDLKPVGILPPAAAELLARRDREAEEARAAVTLAEAQLSAARSDLAWLQARIAADDVVHLGAPGDPTAASELAGRAEKWYRLDAALAAQAKADHALAPARRKNTPAAQLKPLEKASADAASKVAAARAELTKPSPTYTPLTPTYPRTSSGRRAALAKWVAGRDNPLTARVAVNHLWAWHFGRPLVESTNNFGRSGKRPSHPELLDWLAVAFMDGGWRQKPLHRLIVTSTAYRMQSRRADAANDKADADNVYLGHFPTVRMEAEVVRDSLLHAAGELDLALGGHELPQDQGLTARRRSLYFAHHGEERMMFLDLFDAANPCDAYRRTASVIPQQALALSNSELARRLGRVLAGKLTAAAAGDEAFVTAAFEQVLGRPPKPSEASASLGYLARQKQLFEEKKAEIGKDDPSARARENLVQALFNHNDFVTIR